MSNYVFGTGYPIITAYDGVQWSSFNLSHCDSKGLQIKFTKPDRIYHKCKNGKLLTKNYGFYIQFILNYQELSNADNSIKIAQIKNYDFLNSKEIWITPYSNSPTFKFKVIELTEEFEMTLENNSDDSAGQTGNYLVFQTDERKQKYEWFKPDNSVIIFDDFLVI
jgi:hypothetical protein